MKYEIVLTGCEYHIQSKSLNGYQNNLELISIGRNLSININ